MTKIKLDSAVASAANDALTPHVGRLYSALGTRVVGVIELAAVERTQAAADEDREAAVKLQIKHLEIAGPGQEEAVRLALRALHVQRTAYGTINEDGDIELAERTLSACAGELNAIEAARLHVVVERYAEQVRGLQLNGKLTLSDLRRELKVLADGLHASIHPDVLVPAG